MFYWHRQNFYLGKGTKLSWVYDVNRHCNNKTNENKTNFNCYILL